MEWVQSFPDPWILLLSHPTWTVPNQMWRSQLLVTTYRTHSLNLFSLINCFTHIGRSWYLYMLNTPLKLLSVSKTSSIIFRKFEAYFLCRLSLLIGVIERGDGECMGWDVIGCKSEKVQVENGKRLQQARDCTSLLFDTRRQYQPWPGGSVAYSTSTKEIAS